MKQIVRVACSSDATTGARKPIMGDWLTIKPFRDMTYAQRQTYLNRVFRLKAKPSAERAA